jgi:Fic family protein
MQTVIRKIDLLINELKLLPKISEENQRKLDKKFRLEFSYNSNHIEGNTLTYGETELLLIFDKTEGVHEMREYEEMKAHDVAYQLLQDWADDKEHPLTETYIKQLNEIILVKPFWKEAQTTDGQQTRRLISIGEYKKHPNSVRLQNGEMFNYATLTDTPIKMGELIEWYNLEVDNKELHTVELAALLHYKFVSIHPFDDGNGRISRLLMNYILLKNNLPPIIIKTADKKTYLNALNQADVGNTEAFVKYIGEQLIWSLGIVLKATKGENIDEVGDFEKKISLLKKELNVETDLKKVFGVVAFEEIIENSIIPLLKSWEKKLKQLDTLFYNRKASFILIGTEVDIVEKGESIDIIFFNFYETLKKELKYKEIFNGQIELDFEVEFNNLRFSAKISNYTAGRINIKFLKNGFEVLYFSSNSKILKLYSENITKDEIENITSSLANWFYNSFEKDIQK